MSLRRKEFGEDVASTKLDLQPSGGTKKRVAVRIGKPYCISAQEWASPVELRGHEPRYPDIRGADPLQALCLAISLIRSRLEDFMSKGGKVLHVEDGSLWGARELAATFGRVGGERSDAG
jgi:hypothetical protein